MQSLILTKVSDCDLLIAVTSSTFLKRKDMLKEKKKREGDGFTGVEERGY